MPTQQRNEYGHYGKVHAAKHASDHFTSHGGANMAPTQERNEYHHYGAAHASKHASDHFAGHGVNVVPTTEANEYHHYGAAHANKHASDHFSGHGVAVVPTTQANEYHHFGAQHAQKHASDHFRSHGVNFGGETGSHARRHRPRAEGSHGGTGAAGHTRAHNLVMRSPRTNLNGSNIHTAVSATRPAYMGHQPFLQQSSRGGTGVAAAAGGGGGGVGGGGGPTPGDPRRGAGGAGVPRLEKEHSLAYDPQNPLGVPSPAHGHMLASGMGMHSNERSAALNAARQHSSKLW